MQQCVKLITRFQKLIRYALSNHRIIISSIKIRIRNENTNWIERKYFLSSGHKKDPLDKTINYLSKPIPKERNVKVQPIQDL